MKKEILNAKIKDATIFIEDHGFLTSYIYVEHKRGTQSFGGFALDVSDEWSSGRLTFWVTRILTELEVKDFYNLKGLNCRVALEDGLIRGIGHWFKDQWFHAGAEMYEFAKIEREARDIIKMHRRNDEADFEAQNDADSVAEIESDT